ncbi:MAG: GHKL domain-containing protein [Oscillospiraceae bacterium]|nr:GHKL domain-containing protein [Oscillospiraceae bacterium]
MGYVTSPGILSQLVLVFPLGVTFLAYFAIAKILTLNKAIRLKESLYIIFASLFITVMRICASAFYPSIVFDSIYFLSFQSLIFLYFYKMNSYPVKKAIILLVTSVFSSFLIQMTLLEVMFSFEFFHFTALSAPALQYRGAPMPHPVALVVSACFFAMVSIPVALIAVKFTKVPRKVVNASSRLQTILAVIAIAILAIYLAMWIMARVEAQFTIPSLFSWNMLAIYGTAAALFACFFFYARFLRAQLALQQEKSERENLQFYLGQIEQQQTAIQKFRHDYLNILASLDSFLDEDDLAGLKDYYATKIKPASAVITDSNFTLGNLRKIKVSEVKSIFTAKLIQAQNMDIDTVFEADEDIEVVYADTVALVRMLGIILDNAIEAIEDLGHGTLLAGCFKQEGMTSFIVQNPCREDTPALHKLVQSGFSTKGKNRGLGLNNLSELVNSQPNMTLETNIENNSFTQRLMIAER